MADRLANPVWQSLTSTQRHLALGTGPALRFDPAVAPFVAIERDDPDARAAALAIVEPGEAVYFVGVGPGDLTGWALLGRSTIVQMHWSGDTRFDADRAGVVPLGTEDSDDMVALTRRVFPGYFRARTVELGGYVGVRHEAVLVAMAGERLAANGYREVSGVCTAPEHAGRGLAGRLSTIVASGILARGERPFLHAGSENARARALYERLGFETRLELPLWHVRRDR